MKRMVIGVGFLILMVIPSVLYAQVPNVFSYSGMLTTPAGEPRDGTFNMTFRIFGQIAGGNPLAPPITINNVVVRKGQFSVVFDNLPPSVFQQGGGGADLRYIEVQVGSESPIIPRQRLISVPFAQRIATIDGASGGSISGNVAIAATVPDPQDRLVVQAGMDMISSASRFAGDPLPTGEPRRLLRTTNAAHTQQYWSLSVDQDFNTIYHANRFDHIFMSGPQAVVRITSNGVGIGGYGQPAPASPNARVHILSDRKGIISETNSSGLDTKAVWGFATATQGANVGVVGETRSTTNGAKGVWGLATANNGDTVGVYGESSSRTGVGVLGISTATEGPTDGVRGVTNNPNAAGVSAHSAGRSRDNLGLFVYGRSNGTGTKSAVVPLPNGQHVLLYTEESTEVWFTDYGRVQLADGQAVVHMDPEFLQTVNTSKDYHVFVTAIGNPSGSLYIDNQTPTSFEIHETTGSTNIKVSYRIVAKRKDFADERMKKIVPETIKAAN